LWSSLCSFPLVALGPCDLTIDLGAVAGRGRHVSASRRLRTVKISLRAI
jgi:hypothetical protein